MRRRKRQAMSRSRFRKLPVPNPDRKRLFGRRNTPNVLRWQTAVVGLLLTLTLSVGLLARPTEASTSSNRSALPTPLLSAQHRTLSAPTSPKASPNFLGTDLISSIGTGVRFQVANVCTLSPITGLVDWYNFSVQSTSPHDVVVFYTRNANGSGAWSPGTIFNNSSSNFVGQVSLTANRQYGVGLAVAGSTPTQVTLCTVIAPSTSTTTPAPTTTSTTAPTTTVPAEVITREAEDSVSALAGASALLVACFGLGFLGGLIGASR